MNRKHADVLKPETDTSGLTKDILVYRAKSKGQSLRRKISDGVCRVNFAGFFNLKMMGCVVWHVNEFYKLANVTGALHGFVGFLHQL